jgi:hypothetical protein
LAMNLVIVAYVRLNEGCVSAQATRLGFERPSLCLPAAGHDGTGAFLGEATAVARPMPVRPPVITTTGLLMFLILTLPRPAGRVWLLKAGLFSEQRANQPFRMTILPWQAGRS